MEKPFILHMLTTAKNLSPFDVNMAMDAGWVSAVPYINVELGEIQGLVTLEDIVEALVGKFTTRQADVGTRLTWDESGTVLVDGAISLRELNRQLELDLPLDGPRTLNGLIVEHLQDIPEVGVGMRISGIPMEIIQTQNRKVKMVRLHYPGQE